MLNLKELWDKVKPRPKDKPKTEKELAELKAKWLEEALIKQALLNKLINTNSGWKEYIDIIQEYIERCYIQKMEISVKDILSCSKDEQGKKLMELALLDEDIYILTRMIQSPTNFIKNIEAKVKENAKS